MACDFNYDLRCNFPYLEYGFVDSDGDFVVEQELLVSSAVVEIDYAIEAVTVSGLNKRYVPRTITLSECEGLSSYTPSSTLPSSTTVMSEISCDMITVSGEFQDFAEYVRKFVECDCTATCDISPTASISFVSPNLNLAVASLDPSCGGTYTASLTITDSSNAVVAGFPQSYSDATPPPATLDTSALGLPADTYTATLSITDCIGTATASTNFNIVITADAVDDAFTGVFNQPFASSVPTNDVPCSSGATTYDYSVASVIGGAVSAFDMSTGAFTFTPSNDFVGTASFTYDILCNGGVVANANVSIVYA